VRKTRTSVKVNARVGPVGAAVEKSDSYKSTGNSERT
jgi:hypothetical protein